MGDGDCVGAGGGLCGDIKGEDCEFFDFLTINFHVPVGVVAHFEHKHAILTVLGDVDLGRVCLLIHFFIFYFG